MTAVIKKHRRRVLKTSFAKRKLAAKKIAAESTLLVVPMPQRVRAKDDDEDADTDQGSWIRDW